MKLSFTCLIVGGFAAGAAANQWAIGGDVTHIIAIALAGFANLVAGGLCLYLELQVQAGELGYANHELALTREELAQAKAKLHRARGHNGRFAGGAESTPGGAK